MSTRLYSNFEILAYVANLANKINASYTSQALSTTNPLHVIVVLKGSINFYAALSEYLTLPINVHFVTVKSFDEKTNARLSHEPLVHIDATTKQALRNSHVLILDDICDSGYTISVVAETCHNLGAFSVKTATLLINDQYQGVQYQPTFTALKTHGHFVYGFGMDSHNGLDRNLPDVHILKAAASSPTATTKAQPLKLTPVPLGT